jgi:guanylate kinase
VLITVTGQSGNGKSTLLNALRQLGVKRVISTTTRPRRQEESDNTEYHFVTEEQCQQLEATGQFIELITYRGAKYGVTYANLDRAIADGGIAAVILDPKGAKLYEHICAERGYLLLRVFVHVDRAVRLERLKQRVFATVHTVAIKGWSQSSKQELARGLDRLIATLTEEVSWFNALPYDCVVYGDKDPASQAAIILKRAESLRHKDMASRLEGGAGLVPRVPGSAAVK